MALSTTTIETTIDAAFQAVYGPPIDPVEFAKFKTALASVIHTVLTSQATVTVTTNGATGTGPSGGPLPIVAQPGTGSII